MPLTARASWVVQIKQCFISPPARYQNELAGVEAEQLAERFYHQALSVTPHVGECLPPKALALQPLYACIYMHRPEESGQIFQYTR
jgi:hypothetical protein